MRRPYRLLIAAGIAAVSAPLLADDGRIASMRRAAGGHIAVAKSEVYALNLDVTLPDATRSVRFSPTELAAFEHNIVRFTARDRDAASWHLVSTYAGSADVLAIAQGTTDRLLYVLDGSSLRVVDFSNEQAAIVASLPIQNLVLPAGGRYIEAWGSFLYVADASLPGFRVLKFSQPDVLEELTSFRSDAIPSEIRARDGVVYLIGGGRLSAVAVGGIEIAETSLAARLDADGVRTVALDWSTRAFVADAKGIHVVDADPSSARFLRSDHTMPMTEPVDRVVLHDGRAFLFDRTGAVEVLTLNR